MRTATINVFQFSELVETSKETARNWYRESMRCDDWWDSVYADAAEIGLRLTGFDIGRGDYATGVLTGTHFETAETIVATHGAECQTRKIASRFLEERDAIVVAAKAGTIKAAEALVAVNGWERCFLRNLLYAYCVMLRNESEFLESDESIDSNILANEYEFTMNGKRFIGE